MYFNNVVRVLYHVLHTSVSVLMYESVQYFYFTNNNKLQGIYYDYYFAFCFFYYL